MKTERIIISTILIFTAIVFISKLYTIQILDSKYKLSADNNTFRHVTQYPARGIIFDRNGELLVYNEPVFDFKTVPKKLGSFDTIMLCKLLNISKRELISTIKNATYPYKPVTIVKQISAKEYASLQEYMYRFPDFFVDKKTVRKYNRAIAAHILGYVGEVNKNKIKKDKYYQQGDYIGISGIERTYENYLRGEKGVKILLVDVHNSVQGSYKNGQYDKSAIAGKNLTSTIDADLQEYTELLLKNKIGGAVAIEPSTGEILALVSSPTYDPNLFVGQKLAKNYREVANRKHKPLYNRALKSRQPPGSTFKTVAALIALHENVLQDNTVIVVNGGYNTGSHIVHDHISGAVNLEMAIQHSSNAYFCHVLKRTLSDKKYKSVDEAYTNWKNHLNSFGLGIKLGIDLPYEDRGLIYPASYFDKFYGKGHWNHNTIISLAIGQGELGFTPLQLANMTATIANQGYYITPHIIKSIDDNEIDPKYKLKKFTKIEKKHFPPVINAMQKVVEAGTARSAFVEGLDICGKTGTAQNPHGADHSIFIAFAPKDNPKIAVAVYIENGGYGSTWAAPIASLMIEKFINDSTSRPFVEKRMMNGKTIKD